MRLDAMHQQADVGGSTRRVSDCEWLKFRSWDLAPQMPVRSCDARPAFKLTAPLAFGDARWAPSGSIRLPVVPPSGLS